MERRKVGILGATGMVGQRFIQLLTNHPWFEITWLAASDRSAGKTYGDAVRWKLDTPLPARIAAMTVQPNTPEGCDGELPKIIFAALDSDIARELEPRFAAAGCAVMESVGTVQKAFEPGRSRGATGVDSRATPIRPRIGGRHRDGIPGLLRGRLLGDSDACSCQEPHQDSDPDRVSFQGSPPCRIRRPQPAGALCGHAFAAPQSPLVSGNL